jgi:hypothetical protein
MSIPARILLTTRLPPRPDRKLSAALKRHKSLIRISCSLPAFYGQASMESVFYGLGDWCGEVEVVACGGGEDVVVHPVFAEC